MSTAVGLSVDKSKSATRTFKCTWINTPRLYCDPRTLSEPHVRFIRTVASLGLGGKKGLGYASAASEV